MRIERLLTHEDVTAFKRLRLKSKKKQMTATLTKERLDNLYNCFGNLDPAFNFLNDSEKLDFVLIWAERALAASGWKPGLKTLEQIQEEQMATQFPS